MIKHSTLFWETLKKNVIKIIDAAPVDTLPVYIGKPKKEKNTYDYIAEFSPTRIEITFLKDKKQHIILNIPRKEYILNNKLLSTDINDELKNILKNIIADLKTGSAKFFTR